MRVIPDRTAPSRLADPTRFTGRGWRTDYIEPADATRLAGSRFRYEPGARSHWHVHEHEHEQTIVSLHGSGVVAWEGLTGGVQLDVGDWWHVEPGVPHWHGATDVSPFAHLALTAGGGTTWLHEVSDADYRAALGLPT